MIFPFEDIDATLRFEDFHVTLLFAGFTFAFKIETYPTVTDSFFRFRRSVNAVFFLAAKDGAVDSIAVHAKMAKVSTKNGSQRKILFLLKDNIYFYIISKNNIYICA